MLTGNEPNRVNFCTCYVTEIRGISGNIRTIIRIRHEPGTDLPHVNGTMVHVFGRLSSQNCGDYSVEAIQTWPIGRTTDSTGMTGYLLPRVTVVGHAIQDPQILDDGTILFPVNALAYVRDDMEVATFMYANSPLSDIIISLFTLLLVHRLHLRNAGVGRYQNQRMGCRYMSLE